jgi:benzoyl-CoA-dihydrodiol lyase
MDAIRFDTEPRRYRHWKLGVRGHVAELGLDVPEDGGLRKGYALKLNSYDLGVDIELADALMRIRFEQPEVQVLVLKSLKDRVFCAGANIHMLGSSSHAFKVNFCKFTNETRIGLEELSAGTGVPVLAALAGTASGGGYELALACDHIVLQDDGSTAVSLPEVPSLAVLPGTGGLTRLVDKRRVRRDLADVFSTLAEGVRGKRALEWGLVDELSPRSRFAEAVAEAAERLRTRSKPRGGPGVALAPLEARREPDRTEYRHVSLTIDRARRIAELTVRGPTGAPARDPETLRRAGSEQWALAAFRELDDALLDLRHNHSEIGVIVLRTSGDPRSVQDHDSALAELAPSDWFAREVALMIKRTLKRLELSARSSFALIEPGSCFAGSLLELALAADRSYMLDADAGPRVGLSPLNFGPLPMASGLSRLQVRFLGRPEAVDELGKLGSELLDARQAIEAGLVTFAPDDIDWEDEVRLALEERAAFSPDALTGLEQNLRFAGPETLETKIFGRLSAWQNWIFVRPNAVGEKGALKLYGTPERPVFEPTRT